MGSAGITEGAACLKDFSNLEKWSKHVKTILKKTKEPSLKKTKLEKETKEEGSRCFKKNCVQSSSDSSKYCNDHRCTHQTKNGRCKSVLSPNSSLFCSVHLLSKTKDQINEKEKKQNEKEKCKGKEKLKEQKEKQKEKLKKQKEKENEKLKEEKEKLKKQKDKEKEKPKKQKEKEREKRKNE